MRSPLAAIAFVCAATALGCGGAGGPYTLEQLRHDAPRRPGRSLVRYLAQPNPDVSVCDPSSPSFALARFGPKDVDALLEGFDEGRVAPAAFDACASHLFPSFDAALAAYALDASVASLAKHAMRPATTGYDACLALRDVIEARPRGTFLSMRAVRLADATRARPGVSQVGRTVLDELLLTSELEHGRFRGVVADRASLSDVEDPVLLRRMLTRFPTAEQRLAARSRFVEVAIARSTWPEVHADEAGVHERVVRTGRNAVDLATHPITRTTSIENPELAVLVEQHVEPRNARFFARRAGDDTNLPAIDLRPRLRFDVTDVSAPLSFCGPVDELDVTPCVDAADVARDVVGSRLDADAVAHFDESVSFDALVTLLTPERRYPLPLESEALAESVAPPLALLVPAPTVFADGRDLEIEVTAIAGYYVARIRDDRSVEIGAIALDATASPDARVVTRGRMGVQGTAGARGMDGSVGSPGRAGSCPSTPGGPGGPGGNGMVGGRGGNGGPGGNGGDVRLVLRCERAACAAMRSYATTVFRSEAGPGGLPGSGGDGGRGGNGGPGGSGASCTLPGGVPMLMPAGAQGPRGQDGPRGFDGTRGRPGRAGHVVVVAIVVPTPDRDVPAPSPPVPPTPAPAPAPAETEPSTPTPSPAPMPTPNPPAPSTPPDAPPPNPPAPSMPPDALPPPS